MAINNTETYTDSDAYVKTRDKSFIPKPNPSLYTVRQQAPQKLYFSILFYKAVHRVTLTVTREKQKFTRKRTCKIFMTFRETNLNLYSQARQDTKSPLCLDLLQLIVSANSPIEFDDFLMNLCVQHNHLYPILSPQRG